MPKAFLAALAAILITEAVVYINRPALITDFWNKFLINEHVLIDMPGDFDYLIVGDSIQKTGINPAAIGNNILNLGLPGGKPIGLYVLLERYLKKHKPPKAVFLYVDPEYPYDSLFVILRYFMNVGEASSVWKDLTLEEKKVFIMRYWASLDLRKVGLTVRDSYPAGNKAFVQTLRENRGYMPLPYCEKIIPDDYFTKERERVQTQITMSYKDLKYLDKIVMLAAEKNIQLIMFGFVAPQQLYAILEKTGFNNDYRSFVENFKDAYPNVYFVSNPVLFMENKWFADASHFNREGSKLYTDYFNTVIFIPYLHDIEQRWE